MAFKPFKILKGLLIKEENTNLPKQIEITPGGTSNTKTTILSSQTTDKTLTLPDATDTLVGKATTDVLTNKSIDADTNTITNIENADIKAAAGIVYSKLNLTGGIVNADVNAAANIDASKLGTGIVSNTEFNYLDGVTSAIQTQFTGKLSLTGGTMSGALDLGGNKITSLGTPTVNTDAVTKLYADNLISNVANKQLSNLLTTAINQELRYAQAFAGVIATADNGASSTSTMTLASGDAGAGLSGSVTVKSGTASVNNNSGDVTLQTGTVSGTGIRGKIKLQDASLAASSTGYVWTLDSTSTGEGSWKASSGGGASSLVNNGSADTASVSIFAPYQDSSGTRPSDGNGGTTTGITTSLTTTTPLVGSKSFLLTKDASNRQGGGWSIPFTVDPAYKAKSLKISMDYIVNSGTFVAGTQTTDSDVIAYIYDVTNSQLIEPSNIKFLSSNTTISDKIEATFQTSSSGSSYRLIFHIATTSASAYELKVDNVVVSPQTYVFGSPVTDWQAYTPTFTGVGTVTLTQMFYRRVGDSIQIQGAVRFGTVGATAAFMTIPTGMAIDTNKIATSTFPCFGVATRIPAASGNNFGIGYANATTVYLGYEASNIIYNSNDYVEVNAFIPIVGMSSSVQMSDAADTRIVDFRAYKSGGNQNGTSGVNTFTSVEDTHGGFNLSAGTYTIKVAGDYQFGVNNEWTGAQTATFIFRVNGAVKGTYSSTATSNYSVNSHLIKDLKVDDVITVTSSTGSILGLIDFWFYGTRVAGPQAIAVSESINMRAVATSGQTFANATAVTISYPTVTKDTHSAWNGTQFRAPIAGVYRVFFRLQTNMITSTATNYMQLYKNVSTFVSEKELPDNYVFDATYEITDDVYLLAGETIECKHFNGTGSTRTAITASGRNTVFISRIGN